MKSLFLVSVLLSSQIFFLNISFAQNLMAPANFMKWIQKNPNLLPNAPELKSRSLDSNYELVKRQSSVKDQGLRGQCHNFAVTAALEFAVLQATQQLIDLSEQCNAWKFYSECECSGNPTVYDDDGGSPPCELKCIKNDISKFEKDFPYSKSKGSACQFKQSTAPYFSFDSIVVNRLRVQEMKPAIDSGYVIVYSTLWPRNDWSREGEYFYSDNYPDCSMTNCGGHAVLIVGYDDNYFGKDQGAFIAKNSWGNSWGRKSGKKPAGYAAIPYPFVKKYALDISAVTGQR